MTPHFFLTKRQISVKVGKAISSSYSPESSTSQGSIASVAFFNCVMDDLKKTLPASVKCFQFCDDTKLVCITDTKEQRDLLASAVRKFCRWSKRKHLKVNAGKSYALHFNRAEPRRYYFDGVEIPTVRDGLDLGIVVDDGLTWRPHWESAIAQLQQKSQQVSTRTSAPNSHLFQCTSHKVRHAIPCCSQSSQSSWIRYRPVADLVPAEFVFAPASCPFEQSTSAHCTAFCIRTVSAPVPLPHTVPHAK